jgi:CCR4-NOT transcription complex subunit 1
MAPLLRNRETWPNVLKLFKALFRFFVCIMDNKGFKRESVQLYYNGMLRLLLVLLHDFPEFLSSYALLLCEELPSQFIQVRNLILSAFPKSIRPPHPASFTIESLEVAEKRGMELPEIIPQLQERMNSMNMFNDVLTCLSGKDDPITPLYRHMFGDDQESNEIVNVKFVNAFVRTVPYCFYTATSAERDFNTKQTRKLETFVFFHRILLSGTPRLREVILTAMVDEARYPCSNTLYFISFFLYLFKIADTRFESLQEQLVRILLERLKVDEPHPWGVMYIFIELERNPDLVIRKKAIFRDYDFLFDQIARRISASPTVAPTGMDQL